MRQGFRSLLRYLARYLAASELAFMTWTRPQRAWLASFRTPRLFFTFLTSLFGIFFEHATPAQCRTRPLANQSRRNLPYFLRKDAVIGWKPFLRKMRSHSAAGNEPSFCGISTNGRPESVFPKETVIFLRVGFEIVDGILKDLSSSGIENRANARKWVRAMIAQDAKIEKLRLLPELTAGRFNSWRPSRALRERFPPNPAGAGAKGGGGGNGSR